MKKLTVSVVLIILFCVIGVTKSQEPAKTDASKFLYVGYKKCVMCHKGEKKGNIAEIWEKSKHAQAYAALATEQSKEIAKKAGVKGDPQQAAECLKCHVNAYNEPASKKDVTYTMEEGVSCEACHGPGLVYKNMKVMKDIYAGTAKAADFGLIEPTKEVCIECHNRKSPTYKEFKFEEEIKIIAHHVPKVANTPK